MLLAPGPLPQLAPNVSALQPDPPEFEALANDTLADLPQLDDDLGTMTDALALIDVPAEFDVIDQNLDTSDQALVELASYSTSVHVDVADNAVTDAQGNIQLLVNESPQEAWEPVPAPMASTSGTASHPGENGPTHLTIDNTSRPGDTQYYSGDSFRLTVQVDSGGGNFDFANKPISLTRSLNGVDEPELPIGTTDAFGHLVYNSAFDDSSVGDRVFGVDPPGYGTTPQVTITVNPGPAPSGPGAGAGSGQVLSAALQNLSTGDATTFHVLDVWSEKVTGPPGQPVYLRTTKDGVDQGELFIGYTDGTGSLVTGGTINASQLGSYVETFRVAAAAVPDQITFTVVA